jgi:Chitobiase/beta-hexosaminidase C-terminal domain/EPTP domain/Dockerin type I domain/Beta-propeller repeat
MRVFTSQLFNLKFCSLSAAISALLIAGILSFAWIDDTYAVVFPNARSAISSKIAKISIPFIANEGQADEKVAFYARSFGGVIFIAKKGEIVYSLHKSINPSSNPLLKIENQECRGLALKEALVDSDIGKIAGEGRATTRISYFKGNDPSKWKNNIPTFDCVDLGEVYEGIDLRLKAYGDNVEKLFSVKPGADPAKIRLKLNGAKAISVNAAGELEAETGLGIVKFTKPVAYQQVNGLRKYVQVAYTINGNEYGFDIGNYDRTKNLIIDPLLASTFLGGGNDDVVKSMASDSSGNIYVTGTTLSSDFPASPGAYDETYNADYDTFISKFDANLKTLMASTYFGGSVQDHPSEIAVDGNGNVYVVGYLTNSSDFPTTPGAYDTVLNGDWDAFVSKFDSNLENLLASTYLGGGSGGYSSHDFGGSILIHGSDIYVCGLTRSPDFPTTINAYDRNLSSVSGDAFISRFDSNLENILSSTYLGGGGDNSAVSICMDVSGNVYVYGQSQPGFPTTAGAYDGTHDGGPSGDVFDITISKLDGTLENLLASTYLGGSDVDRAVGKISLDGNGNVYVTGNTDSSSFPTTPGVYDSTHNGDTDVFVSKLDSNLENLLASTFLGGSGTDQAYSMFIAGNGTIYVTGPTGSSDFPVTANAVDTALNGQTDAFVSMFDSNLESLMASTFLGEEGDDCANSIIVDANGKIVVAGYTDSTNYPTTSSAYDETHNGGNDAFVTKFVFNTSSEWKLETVDETGDVGQGCSVVVDDNAVVHIAYVETSSPYGNLKYAKYESGSWSVQTLDNSGEVLGAWQTSIILDNNSRPHIAYATNNGAGSFGLYHVKWNGTSWESTKITSSHMEYPALALGSNDYPHISCNSSPDDDLHHIYWNGSSWVDETVDTTWNCGVDSSIVIEENGHIHISYRGGYSGTYGLRYAKWDGATWNTETVQASGAVVDTSLQLDSNGYPCIAYGDTADNKLKYAYWNGSEWVLETIGNMSFFNNSVSLAMNPSGEPQIAYYAGDQRLGLAYFAGSQWFREAVDPDVMQDVDCSLTTDSSGIKYIAYYDGTNGHLKLAKSEHFEEIQAIPTNAARDWESFTVNGETYLAVANSNNGSTRNIDSKIYKWNGTAFVEIQAIPTNTASDWESFTINEETYLAVANYHNGSTRNIDSKIYKWNGSAFVEIQAIPTNGALDWESFTINGEYYLAVANYYNESTHNIDSKIYKWNGSTFVEIHAILTNGAHDWESFTINGETYLAVANYYNESTHNIDSKIYKWNGSTFVEIQAILTNGGNCWESFEVYGEMYLAVTNGGHDSSTHNTDSKIYKWNGSVFKEVQAIPTNGGEGWESFEIYGERYLAVANTYNDSTFNIESKIYKWSAITEENQNPNTPSSPNPANGVSDVPLDTTLSWTGGDPDAGNTVTYDVYFGTSGTTPPLVATDHGSTTYNPGTLGYNTTYDWKIVARDNHSAETEGLLWSFTTEIGDTEAPTTTADPVGGTYYIVQQVTLACDDGAGFGCNVTYYTTDGSEPTSGSSTYSSPIDITEDTTLKFFSVDLSGNTEVVRTEVYNIEIDTDGPAMIITWPGDGSFARPVPMISGIASDVSGVSEVQLQVTDGTFYLDEGPYGPYFTNTESWVTPTGTETWVLYVNTAVWDEGIVYSITARATDTLDNSGTNTSTFTYAVPSEPSTITCVLSDNSIILGEPLEVSGLITPAPNQGGAFVDVVLMPPEGQALHIPVTANSLGEFSYDVECGDINRAGEWIVLTSWAGDGTLEEATSEEKALNVTKAETRLTLNLTSQAIKLGDKVSISGKFTPQPDCGGGLSGIPLSLIMSGPGDILDIQSIQTTDQYGHFSIQEYTGFNVLGDWTVKATFAGNNAYNSANSAQVQLKVVETAGYAIVVQGKAANSEGLASHNKTADAVYNQLLERGLLADDIMYFNYAYNSDPEIRPEIDALPTSAGIQDAITIWAVNKMDAMPANLYIIMVDHGFSDVFYIDQATITSSQLGGWFDTLQSNLSGGPAEDQEIIVILGFCRSGSFIGELSGENRIIIASAAFNESSTKGPMDEDGIREGEYFLSEFFKEVSFGKSVKECFEEAARVTKIFRRDLTVGFNAPYFDKSPQHPLLDDDGDGTGSHKLTDPEGDGLLSGTLFIGVSSITGNDPGDVMVTDAAPARFVEVGNETADLWARVDNNDRLGTIWAEIKPPGYTPSGEGESGQVEMDLTKTVYSYYNSGEDRYTWSALGGFTDPGTYEVFYFAKDDLSGNVSPLAVTRVYKAESGNTCPLEFSLLSPEDGSSELTTVVLDWDDTIDPDGDSLTYTVLLSKNDDSFGDPIRKEGLPSSTCYVDSSDGIEDLSAYFWKVQAIDEYGAIQESGVSMFYTDNTNLPQCVIEGHVYESGTTKSISNAVVKAGNRSFYTEALGGYYLALIDPGTYTFTVSATGYITMTCPGVFLPEWGGVTTNFPLNPLEKGDVNGDGTVDESDVSMVLQILTGKSPTGVRSDADVNGDGKIGMEEVIYIKEIIEGVRE